MERRIPMLRLAAVALLLFGLVYEVGHMRHHWEHARHHGHGHGDDPLAHRDCLLYHGGALTEEPVTVVAEVRVAALPQAPNRPRPATAPPRLLPEPRAPPVLPL